MLLGAVGRRLLVPRGNGLSLCSGYRCVSTAGCLVIGNEILNGTVQDGNITPLAQFLHGRGIELKKVEIISDNEKEIVDSIERMKGEVDIFFTTGGIGSTHDDITYSAIAKAYGTPLVEDSHTVTLLENVMKRREKQMTIERKKMCTFPENAIIHRSPLATKAIENQTFALSQSDVDKEGPGVKLSSFWVPLVSMENQCYVFPGVPHILRSMLEDFSSIIPSNTMEKRFMKNLYVDLPEGDIAGDLEKVEKHFHGHDSPLQLGSYPEVLDESNEKYQVRINLSSLSDDVISSSEKMLKSLHPFQDHPIE